MSAEFEKEVRAQVKRRAAIVRSTDAEVKRLLALALQRVLGLLADQPTDYQLWALPNLAQEIGRIAAELGDAAGSAAAAAAGESWAAGRDLVLEPIAQMLGAEGDVKLAAIAPRLNARVLTAMQHFMADRLKDVSLKAAGAINSELGLVVIGAQSPWDAQGAIRAILKDSSASRAATIVRTELLRVYSVASYQSMAAAADAGIEMEKVWRRSAKAHPRVSHALADGQRVAWDQPFLIGGEKMMHPHDPKASPANTINCGCVMVPRPKGWQPTTPDHRPFTAEELARNPTLKAIVEERQT